MPNRKKRFFLTLFVALPAMGFSVLFSGWVFLAVLSCGMVVLYLAGKPLLSTPSPLLYLFNNALKHRLPAPKAAVPQTTLGGYHKTAPETFDADFYIALDGNDENDGSRERPFRTFERAKQAVRKTDRTDRKRITVAVCAGEYNIQELSFSAKDGGTNECEILYRAHGGEVTLNGGLQIPSSAFSPVRDPAVLRRLKSEAKRHIVVTDLKDIGLTREQIGKIYPIGSFHNARRYDGDWLGPLHCELFANDERQTLARYPNHDEYAKTGVPVFIGRDQEPVGPDDPKQGWIPPRNPAGDRFKIDEALAARVSSWKTLKDVWMFGFWKYDWADASTPIASFDAESQTLCTQFMSMWGMKKNAPFYFFNVLEELDAPGEWYLDRDHLLLYLYPTAPIDSLNILLSVTTRNVIRFDHAEHITFDGFTIKGTRGDAVGADGNHIKIRNCTIKNAAGNAVVMNGLKNSVVNCHIHHVGRGGIVLNGGDRELLTGSQSTAESNLIHSWSQIYKTYCPGIDLKGVGNICRNNELYDCPHEVIWYHGNNHLIEYNLIHDACLQTLDGGAIYAGKSWSDYGNVVRYNCIHDLGQKNYTPCAIYMDDALSGQSVYGNLLVNIPGIAIQLGGGRDLWVKNNLIINCARTPISYDRRAREGALFDGWFKVARKGEEMWKNLRASPYQSSVWKKAYPQMTSFCEDFQDADHPGFVPNPANSEICGNIILDRCFFSTNILCREASHWGRIEGNRVFPLRESKSLFRAAEKGDYALCESSKIQKHSPDFEDLPLFGRRQDNLINQPRHSA